MRTVEVSAARPVDNPGLLSAVYRLTSAPRSAEADATASGADQAERELALAYLAALVPSSHPGHPSLLALARLYRLDRAHYPQPQELTAAYRADLIGHLDRRPVTVQVARTLPQLVALHRRLRLRPGGAALPRHVRLSVTRGPVDDRAAYGHLLATVVYLRASTRGLPPGVRPPAERWRPVAVASVALARALCKPQDAAA